MLAGATAGCNLVFGLDEGSGGDGDGAIDAASDGGGDGPELCDDPVIEEDGDGKADSCDNCPHVPNSDQLDEDEDKVGTACDPDPGVPNDILLFEGFNDPDLTGWVVHGGSWVQEDGFARQIDSAADRSFLLRDQAVPPSAVIGVGVHVDALAAAATDPNRNVGLWFQVAAPQPGLYPDGSMCELNVDVMTAVSRLQLEQWAAQDGTTLSAMQIDPPFAAGRGYSMAATGIGLGRSCTVYADGITFLGGTGGAPSPPTGEALALRTRFVAARWSFVVVISRP